MKNEQKDAMFHYLIKSLDSTAQATLAAMYNNSRAIDEINHRREIKEMEQRITENVLKNVSIQFENIAMQQLRDILNNLGMQ